MKISKTTIKNIGTIMSIIGSGVTLASKVIDKIELEEIIKEKVNEVLAEKGFR